MKVKNNKINITNTFIRIVLSLILGVYLISEQAWIVKYVGASQISDDAFFQLLDEGATEKIEYGTLFPGHYYVTTFAGFKYKIEESAISEERYKDNGVSMAEIKRWDKNKNLTTYNERLTPHPLHVFLLIAFLFFAIPAIGQIRYIIKRLREDKADTGESAAPQPTAAQTTATKPTTSTPKRTDSPTSKKDPAYAGAETASAVNDSIPPITFEDIAGYKDTKKSMMFLVNCMQNAEILHNIGSKIPTGVILYGPPGTGKTLMGKAIAGSAGVPFFYASGAQFMETYVGTGAKNIRTLYSEARKNAPCIVFIDEIDAIGCNRGGDTNGERRHTLDELLTQLDGVNATNNVMTIIATNDLEHLDSALIRPGRFDRRIAIPLPDKDDRMDILNLHSKNKVLSPDVDISKVASMTAGFSGAGLSSLMNEAGIAAVSDGRKCISMDDIEKAFFRVKLGGEEKRNQDQEGIRITAYHETGHILAVKILTHRSVPQATIIGSTSGVGGVTFFDEDDHNYTTKKDLENAIKIAYAGRAAEAVYFGDEDQITTGASHDIRSATEMIRHLITTYGMSEDFGMLNMDILTNGESTDQAYIEEAKKLASSLYEETLQMIESNRELLDEIAKNLIEKESLSNADIDEIIARHNKN